MSHQIFNERPKRKIIKWMIGLLLAFVVIAGGGALYVQSALKPAEKHSGEEVEVVIPRGSSAASIGQILEQKKLIKNKDIFRFYVRVKNISGFQAGTYVFSPSMSAHQMIDMMKSGDVTRTPKVQLTIPEGRQLSEIAEVFEKHTSYTKEQVMEKVQSKEFVEEMKKNYPKTITNEVDKKDIKYALEGYLYPATYSFYNEDVSLDEMLATMIGKTDEVIKKYEEEMKEKAYTPHQLLTMASLIEEEATEKVDREKIASVFYNRIDENMPLQTDPTVLYALGAHKDRVLYRDLEVDSPYNTYKVKGITPGPISNAGEMSIKATLKPAETDYLYFLATPEGEVIFTRTLKEHNKQKNIHITGKRDTD
ncbi:endolytic transglycosylase MltG [Metabacillus iocasae]|uniref:Endolytic murein transglycosylase n=1 Tax=Priestia iocasae TaxID=2291674 RepID=A0ABS2QPP8_9BACI|nr:endolytic transglycosylase MltG [Metabacillus iocasae]MBM7701425.1 UPF0755 protein [Metabacillus iocasae]